MARIALLTALLAVWPGHALAAGGGFSWTIEGFYILDFVIWLGLVYWLVKGPAKTFLAARHDRVKSEMGEALRLKEVAEAELGTYQEKLDGLGAEVDAIRAEFQADGEREKARILNEATDNAGKIATGADRTISQETLKVKQALEAELVAAVLAKAETRVKAQLNAAKQRELFDAYIANLESLDQLDQFAA